MLKQIKKRIMIGLKFNQINKELNGLVHVFVIIISSDINLNCNLRFLLLIQVALLNFNCQNYKEKQLKCIEGGKYVKIYILLLYGQKVLQS